MEGSDDGNSLVNVNVLEQEDTEYTMYLTRAELSRNIYGDRLQPPCTVLPLSPCLHSPWFHRV